MKIILLYVISVIEDFILIVIDLLLKYQKLKMMKSGTAMNAEILIIKNPIIVLDNKIKMMFK
jgi:hypothetical protein